MVVAQRPVPYGPRLTINVSRVASAAGRLREPSRVSGRAFAATGKQYGGRATPGALRPTAHNQREPSRVSGRAFAATGKQYGGRATPGALRPTAHNQREPSRVSGRAFA